MKKKSSKKLRREAARDGGLDAIRSLGVAYTLVFDVDTAYDAEVVGLELLLQLPEALQGHFTHPLIASVSESVREGAAQAGSGSLEIEVVFASIHPGVKEAIAKTRAVVERCPDPEVVLGFLDEAASSV